MTGGRGGTRKNKAKRELGGRLLGPGIEKKRTQRERRSYISLDRRRRRLGRADVQVLEWEEVAPLQARRIGEFAVKTG